jgi:hypothetical protein
MVERSTPDLALVAWAPLVVRRVELIVISSRTFGEVAKRRLDASVQLARAALAVCPEHLRSYDALLGVVHRRGTLLARRCPMGGPDVHAGLLQLAAQVADWIRPIDAWMSTDKSPWVEFASLAEYLLARFPVPRFMASVWLAKPGDARPENQDWYKRLGRGESIRRMGLPVRLTRTMAHRFLCAPHHLTVTEALRWAQVTGLGGSPALAAAVLATRLGQEIGNESFWETVVRFFVNAPELDLAHIGPIVDYLQHQRFGGRTGFTRSGEYGLLPPPRPDLSLKGRTPASLLRLVGEWHRELGRAPVAGIGWTRSSLRELSWIERVVIRKDDDVRTEVRSWSIRELCSAEELRAEGRAMRHCVATYASKCTARQSSIWSMQLETPRGPRHALTIEVDMTRRRIVQARRKCNARPREAEGAILRSWAEREGLTVEEVLCP